MSLSAGDYAWLPDHQLHVAATLAHVDQTIDRVARLIHDYTAPPGALTLTNTADGDQAHVMVTAVAAIPEALLRRCGSRMPNSRTGYRIT